MAKISIQPQNIHFECNDDQTILDAALSQGINFPYGCQNGSCGNCLGQIISGTVEYPYNQPFVINESDIAEGRCAFCLAVPRSDCEIEVTEATAHALPPIRLAPAKIVQKDLLTHNVMALVLQLPQTMKLNHLPGQYVDVVLSGGKFRSFSMATLQNAENTLTFYIKRVDDGHFTPELFNEMGIDTVMRIKGPMGTFQVQEGAEPIVFIAGGTGIAPIKAQLNALLADNSQRDIHLYWGGYDVDSLFLNDEFTQLANDRANVHYHPVIENADDDWAGKTGYVHQAVLNDINTFTDQRVYIAGPPVMIEAARESFHSSGLAENQFIADSFEFSNDG